MNALGIRAPLLEAKLAGEPIARAPVAERSAPAPATTELAAALKASIKTAPRRRADKPAGAAAR